MQRKPKRCLTTVKKTTLRKRKFCDAVSKSKELWKALASLGLPNKSGKCKVVAQANNQTYQYDSK